MNKRNRSLILIGITILFVFVLSACTTTNFAMYKGKTLNVAVIGEPPIVRESVVSFDKISFDDLSEVNLKDYDAVFIMGENLHQAAESQFTDIYSNSPISFFFISATSHLPFTKKDIEYGENWSWSPGNSYAVGVLKSNEDDTRLGIRST